MKRLVILSLLLFCVVDLFSAERLSFDEVYDFTVLGMDFSTKTRSLEGKTVQVDGFMAPPSRRRKLPRADENPVSLCPYCNSDADWPADIIVVYLSKDEDFRQRNRRYASLGGWRPVPSRIGKPGSSASCCSWTPHIRMYEMPMNMNGRLRIRICHGVSWDG